jgi:hypothetical protein
VFLDGSRFTLPILQPEQTHSNDAVLTATEPVRLLGVGDVLTPPARGPEDVVMEEPDTAGPLYTLTGEPSGSSGRPTTGFPPPQPDSHSSPSVELEFAPSISTAGGKVCFKAIGSQKVTPILPAVAWSSLDLQGTRMVRHVHTDKNRRAPYFWSTSTHRITGPPLLHVSCDPAIGDVFVHEVERHGLQVWVLDVVGDPRASWEPVYFLHQRRHPEDPTLFLSFPTPTGSASKRAPTWVKESTAKRHKSHLPNILID